MGLTGIGRKIWGAAAILPKPAAGQPTIAGGRPMRTLLRWAPDASNAVEIIEAVGSPMSMIMKKDCAALIIIKLKHPYFLDSIQNAEATIRANRH